LKQALGIQAQLIPGSGGVFDVVVDGKKVFSKHEKGRFPEPGEVVQALKK
jgi:selenoprotein W-related protein